MNPSQTLVQAYFNHDSTCVIPGRFTEADLQKIMNDSFAAAREKGFNEGIKLNIEYTDKQATFHITYEGGDNPPPKKEKPIDTKRPPETEKKPPQPEPTRSGGGFFDRIGGFFKNVFSGGGGKTEVPQPKGSITITKNPSMELHPAPGYTYSFRDDGLGSFLNQIHINNGVAFRIQTNNPNATIKIVQKEMPYYISRSEGIGKLSAEGKQNGRTVDILVDFKISMPPERFYDHVRKGREAAPVLYKRLTHYGSISNLMKAYLCYAYFQKEVSYATDYAKSMLSGYNADMHMAYGSLKLRKAVCEGYAWGLCHLLQSAGIESLFVIGKAPTGGSHAWAKAKLDGAWYNIDPTINNQGPGISISRFLKSDEAFLSMGYRFNLPYVEATSKKYDDNNTLILLLKGERQSALQKGGDKDILACDIYKG